MALGWGFLKLWLDGLEGPKKKTHKKDSSCGSSLGSASQSGLIPSRLFAGSSSFLFLPSISVVLLYVRICIRLLERNWENAEITGVALEGDIAREIDPIDVLLVPHDIMDSMPFKTQLNPSLDQNLSQESRAGRSHIRCTG